MLYIDCCLCVVVHGFRIFELNLEMNSLNGESN